MPTATSTTVPELKGLLRARGLPVSGTKSELMSRLNKRKQTIPVTKKRSETYTRLQNSKTHDGKCLYMHSQHPTKMFHKVLDKKRNIYRFREYKRDTQRGGYKVSESHVCDKSFDSVKRDVFPPVRYTPYVIENNEGITLKRADFNKPIRVDDTYYACWDTNLRKWVQAKLKNAQQSGPNTALPYNSPNEW